MAGIIHFPATSRRLHAITRRSLMFGAAGYAAASAFGPRALAQDVSTPAATPGASPMAPTVVGTANERLTALLRLVPPDALGGPDPNSWLFTWLDLQAHFAALGNPDPFSEDTNIVSITTPLISNDILIRYALDPEAKDVFGFSVFEAHQILVTGTPPDQAFYYAGGVDVDTLPAVWEASGYEKREGDAGEFWTISETGQLDLDSPVGRFGTTAMNNVAIIQGSLVVFTHTAEKLQRIQALASEGGSSAADDEDLAALMDVMPVDAANVVALRGAALDALSITPENPGAEQAQTTRDFLAESDDTVGPMPQSELAIFGITAGVVVEDTSGGDDPSVLQGNPDARMFVDILTDSDEDADAVAQIVRWRLENMISPVAGYPYSEILVPDTFGTDSTQSNIASLTFTSPRTLAVWGRMLTIQDLWPFAWLPAD